MFSCGQWFTSFLSRIVRYQPRKSGRFFKCDGLY